jgi:hypothetical protein
MTAHAVENPGNLVPDLNRFGGAKNRIEEA